VRPTLFHLGSGPHPFEVHSYGFFIAVGMLVGVVLAILRGRRVGMETGATLDLTFYAIVFGVLGARLVYVLMHAPLYADLCVGTGTPRSLGRRLWDCSAALHIWQGGLVFLGGAVLAAGTTLLFARRKKIAFGTVADTLAPSVSIAHVFGRLGCYMVGCCYGKPWSGGVRFPPTSVAFGELIARHELMHEAPSTYALHPTQIYEAGGELLIFLALIWIWRRRHPPGTVALAYAAGYGLLRFVVEIFRGDDGRAFLFQARIPTLARLLAVPVHEPLFLSSAQATSLLLVISGTAGYCLLRRLSPPPEPPGG
jgi:phosphatidylglycerol---prolipoprotein diacylglyceryl transferase